MFKKIFSRFIRRRHYWRNVGFDELTELYLSMMFRSLATGLVGIFIPIYLYQHGSPVWEILYFYAIVSTVQLFANIVAAYVIARIGPKHTVLLSYVFQAITMVGLVSMYAHDIPLPLIAAAFGTANAFFFSAFHVDFSKVKHSMHAGKEVSWVFIMQKAGAVLGPVLGGVIAYLFGSQYIFVAALVVLCLGIIPLLATAEPTKTKQKLNFKNITAGQIKYDLFAYAGYSLESTITIVVWPLFVGIIVFRDNPYIQLGSVMSLSIIASVVFARAIGALIDKRKGRKLLHYGAAINAVLHLFRPFSNGFSSVLAVNLVNEAATVSYTMPFTKGFYDAADGLPGHRIVYLCTMEAFGCFTRVIFYGAASLIAFTYGESRNFFFGLFCVGAVASYVIMKERFEALKV